MNTQHQQRYILAFPEMDEQHRYLYSLFDALENETQVTDPCRTASLLKELERYLNFHFTCEEHLMRLYNAPDFAVHQSDHEAAAARFIRFTDDFEQGRLNPAALKIFLTGWLMEHSQAIDSGYVEWISELRKNLHNGISGNGVSCMP